MNIVYPSILCTILFLTVGCQRPLIVDDDQMSTEADWGEIEFAAERLIEGLHATPFELQAITENQFLRFNGDNEPLEIRPLNLREGHFGTPAMSDNTFVRLTNNDNAEQILEFHLTKNPAQIVELPVDDLKGQGDEFMEVEWFARTLGAFSDDGTLFLLPTTVLPDRHYVLLLFEVLHNTEHTEFTSVEVFRRIDLTDLNSDFNNLLNIRYVNGNFYVATKSGAWRVEPDGTKTKILQQHILDFFSKEGNLYLTGSNSFDLHESTDNGENWNRLNQNSELIWVETAQDFIFTQVAPSQVFSVIDDDLLKTRTMVLPKNIDPIAAIFYDVDFFAGKYYFSMDRSIFFTEEMVFQ